MDDMNQWLAEFYGTNQNTLSGEELEKAAQASLLQKLADDSTPLDVDDLSDDEVLALADELGLLDEGSEEGSWGASDREKISMIQKVAASADIDIDELSDEEFDELAAFALDPASWEEDEETKEAMAKFAEADFLGRVAAHAQADEMRKIAVGMKELVALKSALTAAKLPQKEIKKQLKAYFEKNKGVNSAPVAPPPVPPKELRRMRAAFGKEPTQQRKLPRSKADALAQFRADNQQGMADKARNKVDELRMRWRNAHAGVRYGVPGGLGALGLLGAYQAGRS